MAVYSSWSDLLPELLDAVFNSLNDARDILNCANVCSSWGVSSSAVYTSKFVPFLFVSHLSAGEETRFSGQFRVLSPPNFDFCRTHRQWVCGSTLGYLLTVNASFPFEVHLHHPFMKSIASLPPLISFEDVQHLLEFQTISPDSETLKNFIKKAVSSASLLDPHWVVLVIYNTDGKLAFCRGGDKQWTKLESQHIASSVDDIVFCNGIFFAMDKAGEVYHCEISSTNPKVIPLCSGSPFRHDFCKKYFAESNCGKLWVVLKKLELNDDFDFRIYFEIYEYNSETKEWSMVRSLSGKALFLSPQGRCTAVLAGDTSSRGFIKDNSIYFMDENYASSGFGMVNLSVFEWASKEIKKIHQPGSWNCQMFWLTPTGSSTMIN